MAAAGVAVRVKARAWAWPDRWTYSGDRANTDWAYNEALYIDLGLAAVALGIGLVLLGVWRALRWPGLPDSAAGPGGAPERNDHSRRQPAVGSAAEPPYAPSDLNKT